MNGCIDYIDLLFKGVTVHLYKRLILLPLPSLTLPLLHFTVLILVAIPSSKLEAVNRFHIPIYISFYVCFNVRL